MRKLDYDTKLTIISITFIVSILSLIIFGIFYTSDFRKEACIQREMACGHVSREVAEKITNNRWFYF